MTIRQKQPPVFYKKGVLNFAKFIEKYLYLSLFFIKVAGLSRPHPSTLLKKRFWHRCFPVKFAKFLRPLFLQKTSGRLLLNNTRLRQDSDLTYLHCYSLLCCFTFKINFLPFTFRQTWWVFNHSFTFIPLRTGYPFTKNLFAFLFKCWSTKTYCE